MAATRRERRLQRLTTPHSAAVAGLVFAALFASSVVLIHNARPSDPSAAYSAGGDSGMTVALVLAPFAGIAFLWFIGVIRDRFGELEDRFFSTVFLGSGLLFVATIFASMSIAGGVLAISRRPDDFDDDIVYFAREVMLQIDNVYAVRMAGVFMISLGTIWLRTGLMPRWLVVFTYLLALALLVVFSSGLWVTLAFPAWVSVISVYILIAGRTESSR